MRQALGKTLREVGHHPANASVRRRQPGPADRLDETVELLAGLDEVKEYRKGSQLHGVGRNAGEVIRKPGQLADEHADILTALRHLHVEEFFDGQHIAHIVDQRGDIIEPVSVGNHLRIGMALRLFFKGAMQVTDLCITIDHRLTVQFQGQVDDAMHRRVRRPHVQEHVARLGALLIAFIHIKRWVEGVMIQRLFFVLRVILRRGCPSNPWYSKMRRKSGWPSKVIPNMSYTSRSNQFAPSQTGISESIRGSSSGTGALRRTRWLCARE